MNTGAAADGTEISGPFFKVVHHSGIINPRTLEHQDGDLYAQRNEVGQAFGESHEVETTA